MPYISISVEGGLFPADLLDRIAAGDSDLPGQKAIDFRFDGSRRITDEIQSAFSDARSYWDAFQRRLERSNESKTTITREDFIIPFAELLGFNNLVVQRSSAEAGSDKFFISHRAGDYPEAVPFHVVSIEQELDRRDGSRRSPHGLVQDYLNSSDYLWGIATNGKRLRLLRSISRISKPTYLEFDVEGILSGNLYSEFVLLYRMLHQTRFPGEGANAHECLLERYYQRGVDEGGRVREKLRIGVENAITILGTAFLTNPVNTTLRHKVKNKILTETSYYRQLLRLIYRLLFLMVSEERKLIFPVDEASIDYQKIYARYYSLSRLRDRADRYFAGDHNVDLWMGLEQTFRILRDSDDAVKLGLSALNGELFSYSSCPDLESAFCTNEELLKAIRELSTFEDEKKVRRRVHYAGLDVEEFGSVYESLLDFHPCITLEPPQFELKSGSERKQTGSYYTPPELVHELIESALVPVIQDRLKSTKTAEEKEKTLLSLRVCDPASGSGHFLLAAARRIARELGIVRSNGQEPSPEDYRHALRDVIRTCVYAVDKNPLAVDLCKVALWIEGHSAGLPLSFLDHHIKCGDSLVGVADLKVLDEGIPDEAYQPVLGDDKQAAKYYKMRNLEEKKRERQLFMGESRPITRITDSLADDFEVLGTLEERSPDEVNAKEYLYNSLRKQESAWWKIKVACDLWTAAFFMPLKQEDALHMEGAPTTGTIRRHLETNSAHPTLVGQAVGTSQENRFFHWPLEFPDVFEHGGFDVVLGNPPWERIKLQEKEFFAARNPEIANVPSAATRRRLVARLQHEQPHLFAAFNEAKSQSEAQSKFLRESGFFTHSAVGDLNTYPLFAELFSRLLTLRGYSGMVCPTGLIAEEGNSNLFSHFVENKVLVDIKDFVNSLGIFPAVDRNQRFSLVTLSRRSAINEGFYVRFKMLSFQQVFNTPAIHIVLSDLALFNPQTNTCPLFDSSIDYRIAKNVYNNFGTWIIDGHDKGNPWEISFVSTFHMTNDAHLFIESDSQENVDNEKNVPLYEAKMITFFDHRFASSESPRAGQRIRGSSKRTSLLEYENPYFYVQTRYCIPLSEVLSRKMNTVRSWSIGIRAIAGAVANIRTLVSAVLPLCGVGNSILVLDCPEKIPSISYASLLGVLNSFVCDYFLRQKTCGVNINQFVLKQLPILKPETFDGYCSWKPDDTVGHFVSSRVLELSYTAWDLKSFAEDCGYSGLPFRWDEERRFLLRCELDAAFFHLYGIEYEDVDYIMETFPIVKRKDEEKYGEFRTKLVILEIYDEMQKAIRTGRPYQTRLDPPPADPRVAHPPEGR